MTIKNDGDQHEKAKAIWSGASLNHCNYSGPLQDFRANFCGAGYELAIILQNLTSSNKEDRERAKKRVRELVKVGQEINK